MLAIQMILIALEYKKQTRILISTLGLSNHLLITLSVDDCSSQEYMLVWMKTRKAMKTSFLDKLKTKLVANDRLMIGHISINNRLMIGHISINSIRNKSEMLLNSIKGKLNILMIFEIKLDSIFAADQYLLLRGMQDLPQR